MKEASAGRPGSIRVLHVDDEPGFTDMAATFLQREDERLEVETAADADDGLARLADDSFDCVVSDHDMPGKNGIEFLDAVREAYPDLPFILYTGKGSEAVASKAVSAGVTEYLQKESGSGQYTVLANRITNAVEQYRSKRAVERSEKRLSLFFEQSPFAVVEWDDNFDIARINDKVEHILGYSEGELIGEPWETIVPESDRDAVGDIVSALLDAEGGHHSINENVTADGERIICEWHNRVVTDADGETVAIFSQFRDITETHRQRERRRRQQEALAALMTDEAVINGDLRNALERITERAADVLDVSRVNVWLFDEDGERSRCANSYDRRSETHDSGTEVVLEDYPNYYQTLESNLTLAAENAHEDPRTAAWADGNLDAHGVGALLDATIRSEGEFVGVVCHGHTGGPREWTDDEIQFASRIADTVYRALQNQKRAAQRQELEQQRHLLSTVIENLPIGVVAENESREILAANSQFCALLGIETSPAELIGSDLESAVDGAKHRFLDPEHFIDSLEAYDAARDPVTGEELVLADGRILERDYIPHQLPGGAGNLWVYEDVTEAREREQLLTGFFETSLDGIGVKEIVTDEDGEPVDYVYRRVNDRFEELTGLDAEDVLGKRATEVIDGIERTPFIEIFGDVALGGTPRRFEQYSEPLDTHYSVSVFSPRRGQVVTLFSDITDRKQYERQLEALNTSVQNLLGAETRKEVAEIATETARDVLGLDANGVHLYDEDAGGLVPVALTESAKRLGDSPATFTPGDSIAWRTYEQGDVTAVDDVRADPDTHDPETDFRSAIYMPLGEHGVLLAGSTDVAAFDTRTETLARIFAKNVTAALEQVDRTQKLRRERRTTERQNERLEEFAGVVAHDVRNPLNVAKGRAELARMDCDSEHLDPIEAALDRMDHILENMLWLAQQERDIGSLSSVRLKDAVDSVWELVSERSGRAELCYPDDDPLNEPIEADYDRLCQLLENLFQNAIDHGGEDVRVSVGGLDDGFYIEDDGSGIPEDDRNRVFEMGFSTSDGGSGFGLRIAQQIVDAHGWTIRVTEGSAGGARFEITGVESAA